MVTERFLRNNRGVSLTPEERALLEGAVSEIRTLNPRSTVVRAGKPLDQSILLLEGIMTRHIDDRNGLRQLVAVHVPGDFVDLHALPLKVLEHDVGTLTAAKVAILPHARLDAAIRESPELWRKLWFATLVDAAVHRAWLFRLGRLDAVGRVAHFLCEMNARMVLAGLGDGRSFRLGVNQSDLAEICGLTSVHVNRVMRQLREARLCIFRSSVVEILDRDALVARAQFDPAYLYIAKPAQEAGAVSAKPAPPAHPQHHMEA